MLQGVGVGAGGGGGGSYNYILLKQQVLLLFIYTGTTAEAHCFIVQAMTTQTFWDVRFNLLLKLLFRDCNTLPIEHHLRQ